jgi:Fic family protein
MQQARKTYGQNGNHGICLLSVLNVTNKTLEDVLLKANFWQKQTKTVLNKRKKVLLNKLLDGFEGKLTTTKWAKKYQNARLTLPYGTFKI